MLGGMGHARDACGRACWDEGRPTEFATRSQVARGMAEDMLRDVFRTSAEECALTPGSVLHDLLGCAVGRVNWRELASAALDGIEGYESLTRAQVESMRA